MITQAFDLNLIPGGVKPVVKASQYDAGSRTLSISLFAGVSAFPVPSGAQVLIQGTKQDGTGFQYECTAAGNVVTAEVAQQMTVFAGPVEVELQILSGGEVLGTGNFILQVEQAALADDTIISETDIPIIQQIPEYVSEAAGYAQDAQESAAEAAAVSKNLWYPTVDADGDISWEKSTTETAPATRNIKGPQGATGPIGPTGATGKGIASVEKIGSSGLVDTYRITYTDGTTFDYTVTNGSSPTYTEGDGINISNNEISVDTNFTEASTRANIASGDSLATIWGKIKKFFTDLKTVAFTGAYSDLSGTENVAVKNANNRFSANQTIDDASGTTTTTGITGLTLGNNKASGTAGNTRGSLQIYGSGSYSANVQATNMTANRTHQLPDASGTIALYEDDILARVTADGVKNYSQVLNELFAELDVTKMSSKSLLYSGSMGFMPVCGKSPSGCSFGSVVPVNNSAADTRATRIMASDSYYVSTRTTTSGIAFTDRSNTIPSSGEVFAVIK